MIGVNNSLGEEFVSFFSVYLLFDFCLGSDLQKWSKILMAELFSY